MLHEHSFLLSLCWATALAESCSAMPCSLPVPPYFLCLAGLLLPPLNLDQGWFLYFFLCMCAYACVCMFVHACTHTCVPVHIHVCAGGIYRDQRSTWNPLIWLACLVSEPWESSRLYVRGLGVHVRTSVPHFGMLFPGTQLSFHDCTEGIFLGEPSPQFPGFFSYVPIALCVLSEHPLQCFLICLLPYQEPELLVSRDSGS